VWSARVENALEALAGGSVAVSNAVRVDVRVAITQFAGGSERAKTALWVTEETVAADVTPRTCQDKYGMAQISNVIQTVYAKNNNYVCF
jgi:hypothetical protein